MTSVKLQRTIPASPAGIYRAWLDPELLLRWSAPVEYEAVRVEVDGACRRALPLLAR